MILSQTFLRLVPSQGSNDGHHSSKRGLRRTQNKNWFLSRRRKYHKLEPPSRLGVVVQAYNLNSQEVGVGASEVSVSYRESLEPT